MVPEYWKSWLFSFYLKHQNNDIFKNIPKNSSKMAVIIEPRKTELIKYVIYNFMYFLAQDGWGLHIFTGTENTSYVENLVKDLNHVYISMLPHNNLTEKMYNNLLTSTWFYDNIANSPEHILVFQTDCILLKKIPEKFLYYDFIGAPWIHSPYKGCNGGLSLRNREKMRKICNEHKNVENDNEDGFFTYKHSDAVRTPGLYEKMEFSIETLWCDSPIGLHKTYAHHSKDKVQSLLAEYL